MIEDEVAELVAVIANGDICSVFQPVVDLQTRDTVAYEALARGPGSGLLPTPDRLFATARQASLVAELDALCQRRALETARKAGLRAPTMLFLNVQPAGLTAAGPLPELLTAQREHHLSLVVEVSERALLDDPARLLSCAETLRSAGAGLALDDVGADPASLALMPLLQPDIVKLDLRVVQRHPSAAVAQIMTAVTAYAEQSGAAIVAEGIETEDHEDFARSLGATHGQGWRYGRPGPPSMPPQPVPPQSVPPPSAAARRPLHQPEPAPPEASPACGRLESPFSIGARHRTPLRGAKKLLTEVSLLLEEQAGGTHGPTVVLASFEEARNLSDETAQRYADLAKRSSFVVVLGVGLDPEPIPGVRGADVALDDPVRHEWNIAVVGPHFSAALTAHDLHTDTTDRDRLFDYVLTYERNVVIEIARTLMSRALAKVSSS